VFKYWIVASALVLTSWAVGGVPAQEPVVVRATFFDLDSYSSESGLVTRINCATGEAASVSAPIAPDVLRDIARSAVASDLFSIDTSNKPIPVGDGGYVTMISSPCWRSSFEVSVGGKTHFIGWGCQSSYVGQRSEIQRLERALAPYVAKLPKNECVRR
jgi:hypothetical protein